ncbi:MAG: hypothetical protein DYG89_34055 [Caldilinea sp. CFX5]|nr:hypothetical protein [Caldilinea sp. CFX5]
MYKSILGAIGLFSLLLFLCAAKPATVLAGTANVKPQLVPAGLDRRQPMTAAVVTTTGSTTASLSVAHAPLQNQRMLEISSAISQEVAAALARISVTQQILYQRDGVVGILAIANADPAGSTIDNTIRELVIAKQTPRFFRALGAFVHGQGIESDNAMLAPPTEQPFDKLLNYLGKPVIIGNPHGVGALPLGIPIPTGPLSTNLLLKQWALAETPVSAFGINLYQELGLTRTTTATGKGVRIVIFDTSPFTISEGVGKTAGYSGVITTPLYVGPFGPLTITVTNLMTQPCTAEITNTASLSFNVDIRSHGLFAAALAYVVAPEATIELVQVLDNYGCGTTIALTQKLQELVDKNATNPMPTVINLSLGVIDGHDLAESLDPLSTTLSLARSHGMVIVAAAGNRINDKNSVEVMQPPASHQAVIGVGASNAQGGLACFSKRVVKGLGPRIAAPGGDAWVVGQCNAQEKFRRCVNERKWLRLLEGLYKTVDQTPPTALSDACSNLLLGMTFDPTTDTYGYANWMGTSFATPIISGWAALQLQNESPDVIYQALTPSVVITAWQQPTGTIGGAAPVCLNLASVQAQDHEICAQ